MKRMLVFLLLLFAMPLIGQWKEQPKSFKRAISEKPFRVQVDTTVYQTSFAVSVGYISSAETFAGARFYGGLINAYQTIDTTSYINYWATLPGLHQEDQSFGVSYNARLWVPVEGLNLDWNAGLLALLPQDTTAKTWIGVPFGLRATYHVWGVVSVFALADVVPAYDVNRNTPSGVDRFGLTLLGSGGIAITP